MLSRQNRQHNLFSIMSLLGLGVLRHVLSVEQHHLGADDPASGLEFTLTSFTAFPYHDVDDYISWGAIMDWE